MVMFQHRINVLVAVGLAVSMGTVEAACQGMALHAHRGAPSAPENSLSAYVAVAEGPWNGMETDIQQLRDGAWVLHHDALTGRVVSAGAAKPVSHLSSTEWRMARMKARDRRLTDEAPPFLTQLIDVSADYPQKTLNIEMKQPYRGCAPIQRVVDQLSNGVGHGNWFLTSIDRENLKCARKFDRAGYLGLIVIDVQNIAEEQQNSYARQVSRHLKRLSLSRQWLMTLKQQVGAPLGIHVDADSLHENRQLLSDARALGISVFTYSMISDERHAEVLADIRSRTQLLPSGAVIDNDPQQFCGRLERRI